MELFLLKIPIICYFTNILQSLSFYKCVGVLLQSGKLLNIHIFMHALHVLTVLQPLITVA